MTLTLEGCDAICGPQQTWYTGIGPRLTAWLIPALLLLANIEIGPLGKRNYLVLLHLMGDPIDSFWSLLHKLDSWDYCFRLSARCTELCESCQLVVATVFAGYEEVQGPRIQSERDFEALFKQYNAINRFDEWRRAAIRFADGRNNELGRTTLAFLLYIFQLICNFVPEVGGAPPGPPGGRIATGVLLSWLVPAILMSNAMGGLTSRRTAYDIMADLARNTATPGQEADVFRVTDRRSFFMSNSRLWAQTSLAGYDNALPWSGGLYMYRPWKLMHITKTNHSRLSVLLLFGLAATPVLIGLIGGVLILWYQLPTGLNCRHVWLVTVALLWNLSALVTMFTARPSSRFATGKYHWRITLVKDACVAIPSVLIMFLSAVGLFNSCWCWSGPFQYGRKGRVPLPETVYLANARSVYPAILGLALLSQVLVVLVIMVIWRRGMKLLRWSERDRKDVWSRVATTVTGGPGVALCTCTCVSTQISHRDRHMSASSEMYSLLKVDSAPSVTSNAAGVREPWIPKAHILE